MTTHIYIYEIDTYKTYKYIDTYVHRGYISLCMHLYTYVCYVCMCIHACTCVCTYVKTESPMSGSDREFECCFACPRGRGGPEWSSVRQHHGARVRGAPANGVYGRSTNLRCPIYICIYTQMYGYVYLYIYIHMKCTHILQM